MNKISYQKELERQLAVIKSGSKSPTLFLHSCCAPCSSYVLEYLSEYFKIMVFYYNPNITVDQEYKKRMLEQREFIEAFNQNLNCGQHTIEILEGNYTPEKFMKEVRGYEECPEGGERCRICFEIRLRETAQWAQKLGFDYFATTLTISPMKNPYVMNEIGMMLEKEYMVKWLLSDFKKKNGYKRSIELSKQYNLYRQDYCGCIFSKSNKKKELENEEDFRSVNRGNSAGV